MGNTLPATFVAPRPHIGVRYFYFIAALSAALLFAATALAETRISVANVLGKDIQCRHGSVELAVSFDNDDSNTVEGTIVVASNGESGPFTKVPFRVAAHTKARIQVPVQADSGNIGITVRDGDGRVLFGPLYYSTYGNTPTQLLLNATAEPRLSAGLLDSFADRPLSPSEELTVSNPSVDAHTGEVLLPEFAATYRCAQLVIIRSEQLATLSGSRLIAIQDYVRSGGTLAVAITRTDDVRLETLRTLVGGDIRAVAASGMLRAGVSDPSGGAVLLPSDPVRESLTGYEGGRLQPTAFGAVASFGWGKIHLLGFEPTRQPALFDPWVTSRLRQLTRLAGDGMRPDRRWDMTGTWMRRLLDPNETARWSIVVSVALLIVYAIVAGPVTFRRCGKRGRALRAFGLVPLWSAVFFVAVLLVGGAVKGWPGQARRLTLIDSTSGLTRAPTFRFRALYSADAREFVLRSSGPHATLVPFMDNHVLELDRDGARLSGVRTDPWDVVVVGEKGFSDLGGGLSVMQDARGAMVVNHTGRDLRALLLISASSDAFLLDRLANGSSARDSDGVPAGQVDRGSLSDAVVEALNGSVESLGDAWRAVDTAGGLVYPPRTPMVLAMVDGGEPELDEPLPLKQEHVLLRVVGTEPLP